MAGGKPIRIAILANARQAIEETNKIKKSLGDLGEATGAGKLRNGFKNLAKGLAIGAAAVVAGVGALAATTVKDLMRVEKLGAATENAIRATGGAAGKSRADVDKMAASLEKMTGAEAESITEGQNMLLTFKNIKGDQFDAATKAALDMGVAMNNGSVQGLDLQKTSIQLGKALNDPIKGISALSKVGVTFNDQQREQIKNMVEAGDVAGAQSVILKELQGEFGGAAEAAGKTTEGMIAKVQNAFGNVAEELFAFLLPLIQKLADWVLTKAMPALDKFSAWFKSDGMAGVKSFGDQFSTNVLPVLKDLGGFLMGTVIPALAAFGKFLMANSRTVLIVAGAITGIVVAYKAYMAVQRIIVALEAVSQALHLKKVKTLVLEKAAVVATTVATKAAAAGQWLLNAAMSANPVGLLIAAIAALVAGLIWFFTQTEAGQKIVKVVWSGIQSAIKAVTDWFKNTALPLLKTVWASIVATFNQGRAKVTKFLNTVWSVIKKVWGYTPLGLIINNWNKIMAWFGKIPGRVKGVFNTAINLIKNAWRYTPIGLITSNWNRIMAFFRAIPGRIGFVFGNAVRWLVRAGTSIMSGLRSGVISGASRVMDYMRSIPSRLGAALGNVAGILYRAGQSIINGLLNGLRSTWGNVTDFVGGIADWIAANKGPLPYDRRLLVPAGKAIMEGLRKGLEGELPKLKRTLSVITEAIEGADYGSAVANVSVAGERLSASALAARAPVSVATTGYPAPNVYIDFEAGSGDPMFQAMLNELKKYIRVKGNDPQTALRG